MAAIAYEDFSGSTGPATDNPLDALLVACNNDPVRRHEIKEKCLKALID